MYEVVICWATFSLPWLSSQWFSGMLVIFMITGRGREKPLDVYDILKEPNM